MRKIFIIIICSFFYTSYSNGEEPKYSDSLNENINKYQWKIKSSKFTSNQIPVEIITLQKKNYIIKCVLGYTFDYIESYCELP